MLVSPAIDIIPRRGGRIRTMHILVVDDANLGAITGEIAVPGIVCDKPDCGCDRGHVGLNSSTMTELVTVHNSELSLDDLVTAAAATMQNNGWAQDISEEVGRDMIAENVEAASQFPLGAVLRPVFDRDTEQWRYDESA